MSPVAVSDSISNTNEQIEQSAKAIGRSANHRKVFDAIYTGKRALKTVDEIARKTSLTRKQVLTSGKRLADRHIVEQDKRNGDTAYRKIPFFYTHKKTILSYAGNKKKLATLPTKRRHVIAQPIIALPTAGADVKQITIDDIDSFARVKPISDAGNLPRSMSEKAFKQGVQKILKEPGTFTDWGGEKNDLYSTRLKLGGARLPVAFGFKGPGTKAPLVPGKMGKNGDQIQRLFQSTARIFFVQFWAEISESVIEQMRALAVAKSLSDGTKIYFGVVDGSDSYRLVRAYANRFQ